MDFSVRSLVRTSYRPIRIITLLGGGLTIINIMILVILLICFLAGVHLVGLEHILLWVGFCFSSINMFFMGLIGEYIRTINELVLKRPIVVEKERINFE